MPLPAAPKHTPAKPSKEEPWLWCLSRGRSRAEKEPAFNYGGREGWLCVALHDAHWSAMCREAMTRDFVGVFVQSVLVFVVSTLTAGDLRPHPIMTPRNPLHLRTVPAGVARPDYAETADPVSEAESKQQQITVQYKPGQIATLRKCCQVARGALDAVVRAVRPVRRHLHV